MLVWAQLPPQCAIAGMTVERLMSERTLVAGVGCGSVAEFAKKTVVNLTVDNKPLGDGAFEARAFSEARTEHTIVINKDAKSDLTLAARHSEQVRAIVIVEHWNTPPPGSSWQVLSI
jgi:putative cell wall-binding protein